MSFKALLAEILKNNVFYKEGKKLKIRTNIRKLK